MMELWNPAAPSAATLNMCSLTVLHLYICIEGHHETKLISVHFLTHHFPVINNQDKLFILTPVQNYPSFLADLEQKV